MTNNWDVVVLGAGPAGGAAARAASEGNAHVLLIDEQPRPGGQVWRAADVTRPGIKDTVETRAGDRHRRSLGNSGVAFLGNARLWQIERAENVWHLHVLHMERSERHIARAVILAPGAREFVQPFPGWTLPGVIGLAGVTALMKSQKCPPTGRVVVAGAGPLAVFAASEILRLGGQVAALVTPNSKADWLRCVATLAANPALARRGLDMALSLKRAGVKTYWRHLVTRAQGTTGLDHVHLSACDANHAPCRNGPELEAATLCVGHGLQPNTEVAALAGVVLRYDERLAIWTATTTPEGGTAQPGLFLCGDGATLRGAEAALGSGQNAGAAALRYLNGVPPTSQTAPYGENRQDRFGKAMAALAAPGRGLIRLTTDDTIVCRCTGVTRATLDTAIDAGARSLGALKSATRCGMGPCGGKYCMMAAARLISDRTNAPMAQLFPPTPRPPLFPLPVAAMSSGFAYDDLPIPDPAPL